MYINLIICMLLILFIWAYDLYTRLFIVMYQPYSLSVYTVVWNRQLYIMALRNGHAAVVEALIRARADVNAVDDVSVYAWSNKFINNIKINIH